MIVILIINRCLLGGISGFIDIYFNEMFIKIIFDGLKNGGLSGDPVTQPIGRCLQWPQLLYPC
jgi:hypothetical protein